jgi:FkbM family methyltransferase
MNLTAKIFKILFIIPFFRKRHFGFYKKIFKPYRLFEGQTAVCRLDGNIKIKADLDEWIQQHIYFLGSWDKRGMNFLKKNLEPGYVFFDIGANIGAYSLVASKIVGQEGKVHSFEPVSAVFERFQENIKLNNITNITANRNAVYQSSQILELFVSSKENAGMSSIYHHDTESGKVEKVEAVAIDDYVIKNNIQRIDLIKIDIEGAELFALKGMTNSLKRFRPGIIIEISDDVIKNTGLGSDEVPELMKSLNYEMKRIFPCGNTGDVSPSTSGYSNFAFYPKNL